MSPFAHRPTSDVDDSSITSSSSSSGSRRVSSDDSSPTPRDYLIRERKPTSKLSINTLLSQSTNSDSDISSSANSACTRRSRSIGPEWTRDSGADDWWDWEVEVEVEYEDNGEDERSEELSDDLEDRTYSERRRQGREGKRPMNRPRGRSRSNGLGAGPVQRILTDRKRTGRRRFRDADDAARINQLDLASLSPPISPYPATRLSVTPPLPSFPVATHTSLSYLSTTHSRPSPKAPTSASAHAPILSPDPAHDDALTSLATTSRTTLLPSSTSSNTVGVVHHVASPIPIIAGTLAGIIALLAAIVVTIIVTRRSAGSHARVRNRRSWLQQQRQHHAPIARGRRDGGGGGDGLGSLGGSITVARVRSRSVVSARSGGGSRAGHARARDRDRNKIRESSRRGARSTSSSNETVSTDGDLHEIRSGPGMGPTDGYAGSSFVGAVDFGARGSVARCFDIPGHHDASPARSSSGNIRKKKPPNDTTVNEDTNKLQEDVEQGYDDEPHVLDSPYIELHIRQHKSKNSASKSPQHPSNAAYHYPPPANAYSTVSSTSSSLSGPPNFSPGNRRSSIHGHQHQYHHSPLPHHRDHTSPLVNMQSSHLIDQSASSISYLSSPPPRTPPPLLHAPPGEFIGLADVKHPNGPPDVITRSDDTEDLPPAYDTM